jgi:hypothetical protein
LKKLGQIVVQSGVQIFREITSVILLSLLTSVVLVPAIMMLPIPFAVIALIILYVPLVTGVIYAGNRFLLGNRLKAGDVLRGAVKYYAASVVFGLLCALFLLILISSWWYYGTRSGMLYFGLAIFQTYFVAIFYMSQLYTLPLIVQQDLGVFKAIGRSVKMFVKHPGYTVGAFLQSLSIAVLLLLTVIGFAALYTGAMSIYLNRVTRNLLPDEANDEEAKPLVDAWTLSEGSDHGINRSVRYDS